MSKSFLPERLGRKRAATPATQPSKLARGTRDIDPQSLPAALKVARGTRDLASSPALVLDSDDDTIVVDELSLDTELAYQADASDVAIEIPEVSEVAETQAGEAAAAIDARMIELGQRRFGISSFRPGQALAIRNVLAGIDTLAIMPTGAGKSLCYQLPALELPGVTLVVSPLIALMKDQHDKLAELDIEVLRLDSTLSPRDEQAALSRLSENRPCIPYVTPERLGEPRFRERLAAVRVALFVVDEAHCISQWGHDFRPASLGRGEAVRTLGRPPVLALTATAPPKVKDDILAQLQLHPADASVIDIGLNRPNLRYHVVKASSERKK